MPRPQREDANAGPAAPSNWSGGPAPEDCWHEMEGLAANGDHAAWASVASQRPAAEDRVSRLVDAIEHDIIPRLVRAHARAAALANSTPGEPDTADVLTFTGHVLAGDDAALQAQLTTLRSRGVPVESLYINLLAPAARHLGTLWEDDRCHFADVTMGLGRLQQIMRGLSAAFGTDIAPPAGGRRALLMPAPGEQHTFGLSMVAEFFARANWEVVGVMDPKSASLQDRVKHEWFDLVGMSAGSTTQLDALKACIALVRRHSHNRAVAVMVGGPLFLLHPTLVEQVGADGAATDGRQAPSLAERLLSRRVSAG